MNNVANATKNYFTQVTSQLTTILSNKPTLGKNLLCFFYKAKSYHFINNNMLNTMRNVDENMKAR